MRYLILLTALLSQQIYGNAFSLGSGEYWRDICEGKDTSLTKENSILLCQRSLVIYQVGALQQAIDFKKKSTLCSNKAFGEDVNILFSNFISEKPERLKEDFIELFPKFLKEQNDCK